ncbi:MAG: acyltransferase [Bacteroidales bacterium]|jgi:acetyltransferase-like isoleucine patch superfamily enzyme
MKRLINTIVRKLGRSGYRLDDHISSYSLLVLLVSKSCQLVRGLCLKATLKKSSGLLFVGRRCRIRYRHLITTGKTLTLGDYVEINALSKAGVHLGDNVSILKGTIIECTGVMRNLGEGLTIGNNVGIAQNGFIQVRGKVVIGDNVIFGPNVSVFSENHVFDNPDIPVSIQGETRKGVTIEEGAWIGTRAVILDGVTVGRNSIVAAGSIVTRDVPAYTVVGGVPAKVLRSR